MAKYFPDVSLFKGEWADNVLWIELTPKKIAEQKVVTATTLQLETGIAPGAEVYNFLAPNEFQENINHTWEPLENIMSGLSQKIASTSSSFEQGTEVYKVDTPLLYKDSNRREVTFLFQLSATGKTGSNPKIEVIDPVKNLMKWSTADLSGVVSSSEIELPYLFQIRTKLGTGGSYKDIVNIRAAAMSSIQPSYFNPYIEGFPTRCELTLTFIDVEPLNRGKSFNRNITVGGM